jgi:hypothetical protein
MSSSSGEFEFWLIVAVGGGLVSFFKGFRIYREYRVVEDTPEIPIRSIPMGSFTSADEPWAMNP